jgi:prophage regulatory protein
LQHLSEEERERRERQSRRDRILREPEVSELTGLSRTTRWRLAKKGRFPAPVPLSEHAVGWKESELQAWIEARQPKHTA